jgi:hypothetical protein
MNNDLSAVSVVPGLIFIVGAIALYFVPFLVAAANRGSVCFLIFVMLVANIVLMFVAPQLVYYAVGAVLWSASAIIAAIVATAESALKRVDPILKLLARASERAGAG